MDRSEKLKEIVKEKYGKIAKQDKATNASSCCGATATSSKVYNIMMDDYFSVEGYQPNADLGLGCGLPTQFAQIQEGDTVIDLGSGAGNDCFVARHEVGDKGKVIGIDFTPAMIKKARENTEKLGFNNIEFRQGDIDDMPVSNDVADVVISNCVLNLVPGKQKVIDEIFRVLKPAGHFSISDIVLVGNLPGKLLADAEMYAGCVAGATQKQDYLGFIKSAGFEDVQIQKEKVISLPEDILEKYLDRAEIDAFKNSKTGIFSVTVFARKPGQQRVKPKIKLSEPQNVDCSPNSGCC